jgi:hypothetical protein
VNLSRFIVTGFQAGIPGVYLPDANVYSGTPAFSSAGVAATANAGSYGITVSQGTLVASSGYNFAFNNAGVLTVNPAALTITADNVTKIYNGVPYSGGGGVTYSGFVNGQNASVLGGAIAYGGNSQGAVNVGTYAIIPSNLTSSNYAITYVDGTLTINQAALTVTANSQTKFIGAPDPVLTYRVTSGTLFGNDTLSGALARAPGEDVGSYLITRGTLSSLNYNLTVVGSTLFIETNPVGMIPASTVINPANGIPVFPAAPPSNVLPSVGGTATDINVNQPRLKIVTSPNGRTISLVPVGRQR